MYLCIVLTSLPNQVAIFKGNITVSMRPMTMTQAIKATEITSHFKNVHGTPIHIGTPEELGITDIDKPDYGEAVTIKPNEVPVFWDVA